jgi:glycosyltransferase involved in cell wall biosynthesis
MIVHSHYPVGEPRGEREALTLVDEGYDVDVICLRWPDEPARETVGGVRVTRLPVQHVRGVGAGRFALEYVGFAARATFAALKLYRQSPIDVVYVHAPPDFLIVTALLPRLLGSGVVLDIHDLSPHMFDARFGNGRLGGTAQRALRLVERAACAIANRVITVHAPYRAELTADGVPEDKILIVMNAPGSSAIDAAKARARPNGADVFRVAYHGTITHWYGVDLLVRAISEVDGRIPRLEALILGEGDALEAAEELARGLGVADRIEFSGTYVSHAEALQRVAGASCGVIPNRRSRLNRFALSSKLLDYVELGIPVVVARLETLAAHFSSDEVTFFEPDDPAALATALAWVAEHPDEAREKAERAQRRAQDYAWSVSRARLLEAVSCAAS